VNAGKMIWKEIVKANWIRDRRRAVASICKSPVVHRFAPICYRRYLRNEEQAFGNEWRLADEHDSSKWLLGSPAAATVSTAQP
jgi:hypothetical protein